VEQFALADQMRRASKAICANIAEGFGRQRDSSAEFKRFLMMATSSSEEMQSVGPVRHRPFLHRRGNILEVVRRLQGDCAYAPRTAPKLEMRNILVSGFWLLVSLSGAKRR
jgi:hypothetical protein